MSSNTQLNTALKQMLSQASSEMIDEEMRKMVMMNIESDSALVYILNELAKEEKKYSLMELYFKSFPKDNLPLKLSSHFMTILLSNINQQTMSDIIQIFACFIQVIGVKEIKVEEESYINELYIFCIENMKDKETMKQRIGTLCLGQLINFCTLSTSMKKTIWKSIIEFLESEVYQAKNELLTILDVFIERIKEHFSPYARITLYKALDFLIESDWVKRKLTLKVIYDLVLYCNDDIIQLKQQIIEFLNVVKNDKIEEIEKICNSILEIIDNPKARQETVSNRSIRQNTFGKDSMTLNDVLITDSHINTEEKQKEQQKHDRHDNMVNSPLKVSDLQEEKNETYTKPLKSKPLDNKTKIEVNKRLNTNEKKEMNDPAIKIKRNAKSSNEKGPNVSYSNYPNQIEKPQEQKERIETIIITQKTTNQENGNEVNNQELDEGTKQKYEAKITDLLKQMKEMSDKQIYLVDIISSLQKNSQEQITTLNSRIFSLESVIIDLDKSHPKISPSQNNNNINPSLVHDLPNIISSSSDQELIQTISSFSNNDINILDKSIIEDIISRMTLILTKGIYIHQIISFLQIILIQLKCSLRKMTIKNLKDTLSYISTGTQFLIKDQDMTEISVLLSYINTSFNK